MIVNIYFDFISMVLEWRNYDQKKIFSIPKLELRRRRTTRKSITLFFSVTRRLFSVKRVKIIIINKELRNGSTFVI